LGATWRPGLSVPDPSRDTVGLPASKGRPLRVLVLNQFYPPDLAPTGRLIHDVAATLARRGHDVRVFCGRHAYGTGDDLGADTVLDGVLVCRAGTPRLARPALLGRTIRDAVFLARALADVATHRPPADLVVAATSPPMVGVAAALAARWRGIAHVQWTMDLYPDVFWAHWGLDSRSWLAALLRVVARVQFQGAAAVLTLGRHMARRATLHVKDPTRLHVIPTWSELDGNVAESVTAEWRCARGWPKDSLVLMYSGNLGRGHRAGEFLEAAGRLGPEGPVWVFVGGGARRSEVEQFRLRHPHARLQLLPYVSSRDVAVSLRSADVHLVSINAAWQGAIVPSKLQAAFSVGRPVIFVGPPDNEMAEWVGESGGGWVVGENDVDGLLRAIGEAGNMQERIRRGNAALSYARVHFSRDTNRAMIADLLEESARA
jgi:colanic acid biosynthesis glycosyl transferase WcaI